MNSGVSRPWYSRRWRNAALVIACVGPAACGKPLGTDECDRLLDHYTARLAYEERPDVSPPVVVQKQEEARKLAKSEDVFEYSACPKKVSREQFECALRAPTVDTIERCLM